MWPKKLNYYHIIIIIIVVIITITCIIIEFVLADAVHGQCWLS